MIFDNIGKIINRKELWNTRLEEVKKYIDENRKRPSKHNINKNIKKLGTWLSLQNLEYKNLQKQSNKLLETVIIPNECFHNASLVFQFYSNIPNTQVEYVLGLMAQGNKIFGHAWNVINGVHYDYTSEKSDAITSKYTEIVRFNDINTIKNLPMFNPNEKCENSFDVDGESFDIDGMCSLYPYYKSL